MVPPRNKRRYSNAMPQKNSLLQLAQRVARSQRYEDELLDADLAVQLLESFRAPSGSRTRRPGSSDDPLSVVTDTRLVFTLASRLRTMRWRETPDTTTVRGTDTHETRGACSALRMLHGVLMYMRARMRGCRSARGVEGQALEELIKQVVACAAQCQQGASDLQVALNLIADMPQLFSRPGDHDSSGFPFVRGLT